MNSDQVLHLQSFDLNMINTNKVILIIDPTITKPDIKPDNSSLIDRYITTYYMKFTSIICITKNENLIKKWLKSDLKPNLKPECLFFPEYQPSLIDNLIKYRKNLKFSDNASHFLLILDDCLKEEEWKSRTVQQLYICRYLNITLIIQTPIYCLLPPHLRSNIDYLILHTGLKQDARTKIYQYYANFFPSFESFNQTLTRYANNENQYLIIHHAIDENDITKKVWCLKF